MIESIDVITIISFLSLAGLTAYYAIQTKKTVTVLNDTVKLSIRPYVKCQISALEYPGVVYFVIKNTGVGSANNVELSFQIENCDKTKHCWEISLMVPNEFTRFLLQTKEQNGVASMTYLEQNDYSVIIKGKYFDILGNEYHISDKIDVTNYILRLSETNAVFTNAGTYESDKNKELIQSLKNIANELKKLNDNSKIE